MSSTSCTSCDNVGKLILRVTLGLLVLLHGWAKLTKGIGGIEGMLTSHGLPAFFAWGVYLGEVLGPVLLIIGVYARAGAVLVALNMLVALLLVHTTQIFSLSSSGGWQLELQGMFLFSSIAVFFLGAGSISVGGRSGRWN